MNLLRAMVVDIYQAFENSAFSNSQDFLKGGVHLGLMDIFDLEKGPSPPNLSGGLFFGNPMPAKGNVISHGSLFTSKHDHIKNWSISREFADFRQAVGFR